MTRFLSSATILTVAATFPVVGWCQQATQPLAGGNVTKVGDNYVQVEAIRANIIHVTVSPLADFYQRPSFAVMPETSPRVSQSMGTGGAFVVTGGQIPPPADGKPIDNQLSAFVVRSTGQVTFKDKDGKTILTEGPRTLEPADVQGEKTFHLRQQWLPNPDESLHGLGQHQYGLVNLKGYDIDLWQHNTDIAVPFLVSSKGYGILWDNPSFTKFGDPRDFTAIPAEKLFDNTGQPGGFTATPFAGASWANNNLGTPGTPRTDPAIRNAGGAGGGARRGGPQESALRWEGELLADAAGIYQFRLYANGGVKMWIDDQLVADHWRQNWLPEYDLAKSHFAANSRHKIKVEWIKDGGAYCTLTWKPPAPDSNENTSVWSSVGDGINYYVIYGGTEPGGDRQSHRRLPPAYRPGPMMPIWAFGLWQSRQRYETQQASLDVVKGFRDRNIPFDNIVQDWMYWRENDWGSHNFDPARFPNPDQWVKDIHALNARVMISVWPKFYPTTDNYQALNSRGFTFPISPNRDWVGRGYQYTFYDAYSPEARDIFWNQMNQRLFSKGFDAWWMDATEPDLVQPSPATLDRTLALMPKTAAGTGARVENAYPSSTPRPSTKASARQRLINAYLF
jgi:alpha-D-xyloside xylohydrolase